MKSCCGPGETISVKQKDLGGGKQYRTGVLGGISETVVEMALFLQVAAGQSLA